MSDKEKQKDSGNKPSRPCLSPPETREAALAFEGPLFEYLLAAPQMSEGDVFRSMQVLYLSDLFRNMSIEARYTSNVMKSKHEISTTLVGVDPGRGSGWLDCTVG